MSSQAYAKVPLSGKYTEEEKPVLQKLVLDAVANAENEYLKTKKSSEHIRFRYLFQPKGTTFETANKIKRVAYSFSPTGEVRYGASIWTREKKPNSELDVTDMNSVKSSNMSNMTNRSMSTESVFTKKNRQNIINTAIARYNKCPRIFKMDFEENNSLVVTNVKTKEGKSTKIKNHNSNNFMNRNKQVIDRIESIMTDKTLGGVKGERLKLVTGENNKDSEGVYFTQEFVNGITESLSEELVEEIESFLEYEENTNELDMSKATKVKMIKT